MKTIGILGGMGPVATAELYKKIIKYCQTKYGAVQDKDYPPIVMYSLPLKGTDETGIINESSVFQEFVKEIKKLKIHGADFVIIPCNTLHTFDKRLQEELSIPLMSIVEVTSNEVKNSKMKKIGLLASETTYGNNLYESYLDSLVVPDKKERKQISQVILHVMGGKNSQTDKKILLKIIENMKVDAVILGCTELPVVLNQSDTKIKIFDSLEILAKNAVDYAQIA